MASAAALQLPGGLVQSKVRVGRRYVLAGRLSRPGTSYFNLGCVLHHQLPGTIARQMAGEGSPLPQATSKRQYHGTSVAKAGPSPFQSTDLIGTVPSHVDAASLNGQSFSLPCQATCAELSRKLWERSMQEPCMITGEAPCGDDLLSVCLSTAVDPRCNPRQPSSTALAPVSQHERASSMAAAATRDVRVQWQCHCHC